MRVVSVEQNTNFNIQAPFTIMFLFFTKMVLLQFTHTLNIYEHTNVIDPRQLPQVLHPS
jgi:hypothetical protein